MDPHLLLSFVAIARNGHLGRAAIELHICKPAISSHLKELERRFQQVLFERTNEGMRLTAAGSVLLPLAQKALEALTEVTDAAKHLGNRVAGTVDIGTVSDPVWIRAPQMLNLLHRHHPDLSVRLHHGMSGQVEQDVREGRLAAGWVLGPVEDAALVSRTLTNVRLRVVGPRSWAQQLDSATIDELADFPWVETPALCAHARHRVALFANSVRQPIGRFFADSERAHYGIAAEGLALSLMREDVALAGKDGGDLAIWPGAVRDLHLRFVIPTIRKDEALGRALSHAALRSWRVSRTNSP
jgi:DNA-binding transcriptional LysR family regulator